MRVCMIVEGAYPFVTGGVSSWLHQLMQSMPDVEFVIQVISAKRDETRKFKYPMLDNIIEVQEIYLQDEDYVPFFGKRKLRMKEKEYQAFESLLFGKEVVWDEILTYFVDKKIALNTVLTGKDFFNMVVSYHDEHYAGIPFTDFLWGMRSMYMPLFTILMAPTVEADVYHSVSSGYAGLWGCIQKKLYNKPLIITEHGLYTREREEEIIRAQWLGSIYKDLWIEQFRKIGVCGYEYADVVTSLFKDAREFQKDLGCDKRKAVIIPNGVDVERYANIPQKDETDNYINVGAILRVTPIKDVKTLITGFAYAKEKDPRLKLWIMGPQEEDPEYAEECVKLIDKLQVKDIIFTGSINVLDYIGKMDVIVLSSISEGQPLVILEAYAAKKPIISTDVGNCRGLIEGEFDQEGNAGHVVPVTGVTQLAYAILDIASNEERRIAMGEIGYERAKRFYGKDDIYGRYRNLYEKVMDENMKG